jgi:hypothetical protein
MFGLPGRSDASIEQRVETQEYLRDVLPLMEKVDEEYKNWMTVSSEDSRTLVLDRDPDGQHAAIYLWRVSQPATELVQKEPVKTAKKFHEAIALCLEARAAAADLFKEAADLAPLKDPVPKIAQANKKLLEAERLYTRAAAAQQELETKYREN